MGIKYLTAEQIINNKSNITGHFFKPSTMLSKELDSKYFSNYIKDKFGNNAKIVELGCGGGHLIKSFKESGLMDAFGIDIDDYLKFSELKNSLSLLDLNKDFLPYADNSIDVVCALQILEHLENPFHTEREVARVLKHGGLFILSWPNGHTIWDKLRFLFTGNLVNYHKGNNHITFLTKDVFAKTFLKDFQLESTIYDHGSFPLIKPRRIMQWIKNRMPANPLWSLNKCHFLIRK